MELYSTRIISSAVILLLIIISGLFLRFSGKPYNKLAIGFHKIASLLAITILTILLISKLKEDPDHLFLIIGSLICGAVGLICFISGVLQSFEKAARESAGQLHKITAYLFSILLVFLVISYFI